MTNALFAKKHFSALCFPFSMLTACLIQRNEVNTGMCVWLAYSDFSEKTQSESQKSQFEKTTSYELHVSKKEMFVVSVFTDDKNQLRTCCCSLHDDFPFTLQISICTQKYHVQTLFYEFYKFGMGYLRTPTFHLKLQCIKTPFFSATYEPEKYSYSFFPYNKLYNR